MARVLVLVMSLILSGAAGAIEARDPLTALSVGTKLVAHSDITFLANFSSTGFGPQPLNCKMYVSKLSPMERVLRKGSALVVNRVEVNKAWTSLFGNSVSVYFEHPEVVSMTCGSKNGWPSFGELQETVRGKFEVVPYPAEVIAAQSLCN